MDLDEERAQWAAETAAVARGLWRLADLARVVDKGPTSREVEDLNQFSGRLHSWSLEVAENLNRPGLAEELAGRQQAYVDWRKLEARAWPAPPAQDA